MKYRNLRDIKSLIRDELCCMYYYVRMWMKSRRVHKYSFRGAKALGVICFSKLSLFSVRLHYYYLSCFQGTNVWWRSARCQGVTNNYFKAKKGTWLVGFWCFFRQIFLFDAMRCEDGGPTPQEPGSSFITFTSTLSQSSNVWFFFCFLAHGCFFKSIEYIP